MAEVNPEDLAHLPKGVASCPNCTTMVLVTALAPLHRAAGLRRMVVSTYQSVSGAGQAGMRELDEQWTKYAGQSEQLRRAGVGPLEPGEVWNKPIAGNVIPLAGSVKEAGDNLKFATAEIRRSPWRLLYKPRPGEVANLNLFDAARDFAEGANNMSDAATALRDALKDPQANPDMIKKLVGQLDESFGKFQKVEDELWKRVKE